MSLNALLRVLSDKYGGLFLFLLCRSRRIAFKTYQTYEDSKNLNAALSTS